MDNLKQFKEFVIGLKDSLDLIIIGLAVCIVLIIFSKKISALLCSLLRKALSKWEKTAQAVYDSLYNPLRAFIIALGIYLLFAIAAGGDAGITTWFAKAFRIATIAIVTWASLNFTPALTSLMIKINEENKNSSEVAIRFLSIILRIVIASLGVVIIISELGYNINGIITGLGLGGLSISLAAKNTASNLISGLEIVTDKPFDVGDYIKTPSAEGIVEDMTMRSTRIRTPDDLLVSVPNSVLMNEYITNCSEMGRRYYETKIGLSYDTDTNTLHNCVDEIKDMLYADPDIDNTRIIVSFESFGDSSLDIRIIYYTKTTNYDDYFDVIENVNFKIRRIVEKNGAEFAYPTQSIYLENFENRV